MAQAARELGALGEADLTYSHDHFGDIFVTLDAEKFQRCFVAWVAALAGRPPA